jgi:hypothetical protein
MVDAASIKQKAASLGFDLCGIAPVDDFPELPFLQEWLAKGYAGEMAWMARTAERRADVRQVVPARAASSSPARCTTPTGRTRTNCRPMSHASHAMRGATTTTTY